LASRNEQHFHRLPCPVGQRILHRRTGYSYHLRGEIPRTRRALRAAPAHAGARWV